MQLGDGYQGLTQGKVVLAANRKLINQLIDVLQAAGIAL